MNGFENIQKDLKEIRKYYEIKQYVLSESAGLCSSYITQIETLKTNYPRMLAVLSIAKVLNRYRKKYKHSFEYLREELGDNVMIDVMEMLETRENRIKEM